MMNHKLNIPDDLPEDLRASVDEIMSVIDKNNRRTGWSIRIVAFDEAHRHGYSEKIRYQPRYGLIRPDGRVVMTDSMLVRLSQMAGMAIDRDEEEILS